MNYRDRMGADCADEASTDFALHYALKMGKSELYRDLRPDLTRNFRKQPQDAARIIVDRHNAYHRPAIACFARAVEFEISSGVGIANIASRRYIRHPVCSLAPGVSPHSCKFVTPAFQLSVPSAQTTKTALRHGSPRTNPNGGRAAVC